MTWHIRCDTAACTATLEVPADSTQHTASVIAQQHGWRVTHGTARDYHHCTSCSPTCFGDEEKTV